jgi:hypothetical protein
MSLKLRLSGNTIMRALTQLLWAWKVELDALNEGLQVSGYIVNSFFPLDSYLFTAGSTEHQVQVVHSFALWYVLAEDF